MIPWLNRLEKFPRRLIAPVCICIITAVGLADYWTGYETFFFVFYLLAVVLGVWFVNNFFGVLMSALSVTAWVSSNIGAGARYSSDFVPAWNALIMFAFYLVVVWLLSRLKLFNAELERRVQLRTESLAKEIRERMRLQKELVEVSERERRRIGHELHDGLCQHLTGTALASQIVTQKLAADDKPEAADTGRIVQLVEQAIELTRKLSRGLSPVELKPGHLREDFQALAQQSSEKFKIICRFECDPNTVLPDIECATHLYHIADAAIKYAVHHGHASEINVCLDSADDELALTITDNGVGRTEVIHQVQADSLKLMQYRADLIGATFEVTRLSTTGARVTCTLPMFARTEAQHGK